MSLRPLILRLLPGLGLALTGTGAPAQLVLPPIPVHVEVEAGVLSMYLTSEADRIERDLPGIVIDRLNGESRFRSWSFRHATEHDAHRLEVVLRNWAQEIVIEILPRGFEFDCTSRSWRHPFRTRTAQVIAPREPSVEVFLGDTNSPTSFRGAFDSMLGSFDKDLELCLERTIPVAPSGTWQETMNIEIPLVHEDHYSRLNAPEFLLRIHCVGDECGASDHWLASQLQLAPSPSQHLSARPACWICATRRTRLEPNPPPSLRELELGAVFRQRLPGLEAHGSLLDLPGLEEWCP